MKCSYCVIFLALSVSSSHSKKHKSGTDCSGLESDEQISECDQLNEINNYGIKTTEIVKIPIKYPKLPYVKGNSSEVVVTEAVQINMKHKDTDCSDTDDTSECDDYNEAKKRNFRAEDDKKTIQDPLSSNQEGIDTDRVKNKTDFSITETEEGTNEFDDYIDETSHDRATSHYKPFKPSNSTKLDIVFETKLSNMYNNTEHVDTTDEFDDFNEVNSDLLRNSTKQHGIKNRDLNNLDVKPTNLTQASCNSSSEIEGIYGECGDYNDVSRESRTKIDQPKVRLGRKEHDHKNEDKMVQTELTKDVDAKEPCNTTTTDEKNAHTVDSITEFIEEFTSNQVTNATITDTTTTATTTLNTTTKITTIKPGSTWMYQGNKSSEESDESKITLIDYPYSVSIQRKGAHYASGALLNKWWVITVAGEFYNVRETVKLFRARLGSVDCKRGGTIVPIKKIEIHPYYLPGKPNFDVALLRMALFIDFNNFIRPIVISNIEGKVVSAKFMTTYWPRILIKGSTLPLSARERINYNSMRVSTQRLIPAQNCTQILKRLGEDLNESSMCLKPMVSHHSVCMPDVGAPVIAEDGLWGITSGWISPLCPDVTAPTIFTRLSSTSVRSWLDGQLLSA